MPGTSAAPKYDDRNGGEVATATISLLGGRFVPVMNAGTHA